ncbi:MAG: hypothetical protein Ta2A_24490 [Treponemataceae bacterium]|nr:MAG: hypothetical protein Ta2A_24490 [Treponemataceae bacterium]
MIRKNFFVLALFASLPLGALWAQGSAPGTEMAGSANKPQISGEVRVKSGIIIDKAENLVTKSGAHVHNLDLAEIAPSILLDGELSVNKFRFDLALLSAIPVRLGHIEEESTLTSGGKNYHTADSTIDSHYKVGINVGYRFTEGDFEFVPQLGFSYRYRKWSADNGTSGANVFSGTLLSFSESTWFPSVGADIRYKLPRDFALRLRGNVYPYIDTRTRENRFTYDDRFYGTMRGGVGGDVFLSAEYRKSASPFAATLSIGYEGTRSGEGTLSAGPSGYNSPFAKDDSFSMHFTSNILTVTLGASLRM